MSAEKFLKDWNRKIEDQRQDLIATAYGFKTKQESVNTGWWSRNYLKIIIYSFFLLSLAICYLMGLVWPFRVLGIMTLLIMGRYAWKMTKRAWMWVKIFYRARKLLKQVSGLKKE